MKMKTKIWLLAGTIGILVILALTPVLAQSQEVTALFGKSYSAQKKVPKITFAKALASQLALPPGKKEKCYSDLNKNSNATASICALKKAGVFPALKKFVPTAKVSWNFAITSLCRAKNWKQKKSWKSCKAYAKKHGMLAAPLPKKINSKDKITYESLALLMERAAQNSVPKTPGEPQPPVEEIPARSTVPLNFTPYPEDTIGVNFFTNILLSAPMPNRFYKDEVYFIDGDLINPTVDEIFIFLCRENEGCDDSTNFIEKTSGKHFRIPLSFREAGNFQIGIIPGRSGQSRVENISVLPELPSVPAGGTAPTTISIGYQEGKTFFRWNGEGTVTRLIIFQDTKRVDYLFRQRVSTFSPPSEDFEGFEKGSAGWSLEHDGASSNVQNMTLTVQDFRKIENSDVEVTSLPEILPAPGRFIFQGKAKKPISKKAALTLPNGQVEEITLASNDLSEGTSFTVEKDFLSVGTYIFEVNNPLGSAVINVPVYVGTAIPLIPDFFALNEPELDPAALGALHSVRAKLLDLINVDRGAHGLNSVTLAPDLNSVAQNHSQNMVNQNFFGHVDPAGNSPDDRRKKADIITPIRENLGKASSLELVEAGLMRSPIHRAAIIDPEMQRVGLGIVKDDEGYYFVTQNFAENPILESDLPNLENELFAAANNQRLALHLSPVSHQTTLRSVARDWSKLMTQEGFFGVTSASNEKLIDRIRDAGIDSSVQMHLIQVSQKKQLSEELVKQSGLKDGTNLNMGIGLSINNTGDLFVTVIYTP